MTHSPNIEADLAGASYVGTAYAGGPESRRSGLYGGFFKRALDVLAVLVSAPIVLPLLLAFGVLIARDGGPVFYSQNRIGRGGKTFRIWKLRSMVTDADTRLALNSGTASANPRFGAASAAVPMDAPPTY